MNKKRVVVTGANGFIGRHLCRKLVESGSEVTACIREQADESVFGDCSTSLKIYRLPPSGLEADLSHLLREAEVVIHLAGRAHVMRETAEDPLSAFRMVNVRGTECLASTAARYGVQRFIYLSSIKVNGEETTEQVFSADDLPGFCDPYGQSKWEAEERLIHIAEASNMEWVIVRPPLVYGPGVKGNFLALMNWVFRRIPLPFGSLHNRRSLISIYNLNDLLSLLADCPGAANNRFVACDPEDISTPELVRRIATALHRSPRILDCPKSVLDIAGSLLGQKAAVQRLCSSLVLDRQKTSKLLGWSAPLSLDSGLDCTAEWFLSRVTRR